MAEPDNTQAELLQLYREIHRLRHDKQTAAEQTRAAQEEIERLRQENVKLRDEAPNVQADNEHGLEAQHKVALAEVAKLAAENAELHKRVQQISELKRSLEALEKKSDELLEKNTELEHTNESLKAKASGYEANLAALQKSNAAKETKIRSLQAEVEQLKPGAADRPKHSNSVPHPLDRLNSAFEAYLRRSKTSKQQLPDSQNKRKRPEAETVSALRGELMDEDEGPFPLKRPNTAGGASASKRAKS